MYWYKVRGHEKPLSWLAPVMWPDETSVKCQQHCSCAFCSVTLTSQKLSLSFKQSMISVCIVLSLVLPRWDFVLFPVFQGILFPSYCWLYDLCSSSLHCLKNQKAIVAEDEQMDNSRISDQLLKHVIQAFLKSKFGLGNCYFSTGNKSSFVYWWTVHHAEVPCSEVRLSLHGYKSKLLSIGSCI